MNEARTVTSIDDLNAQLPEIGWQWVRFDGERALPLYVQDRAERVLFAAEGFDRPETKEVPGAQPLFFGEDLFTAIRPWTWYRADFEAALASFIAKAPPTLKALLENAFPGGSLQRLRGLYSPSAVDTVTEDQALKIVLALDDARVDTELREATILKLHRCGVLQLPRCGAFDPGLHVPRDGGMRVGDTAEAVNLGWVMNGKVLRKALVVRK